MSQTYVNRQKKPAMRIARGGETTPQQAVYIQSGISEQYISEGSANARLDEQMQAKFQQHFLERQIPEAEQEADRLSAGLNARTPEEVKHELGMRLGADFSSVRFHTDSHAVQAADGIGARAYTAGSDVYFGEGGFDPHVAAHELVHTLQQGQVSSSTPTVSAPAGGVQMMPNLFKKIGSLFKRGSKTESAAPENTENSTAVALRPQPEPTPQDGGADGGGGKLARLKKLEAAIQAAEGQVAYEQDTDRRTRLEENLRRMQFHYNKLKDELGYVPEEAAPAEATAGEANELEGEAPKALTYPSPGRMSRAWNAVKGFGSKVWSGIKSGAATVGSKVWGGIKSGAAMVGSAVSGKLNSMKRQHQRAVDDLNHHREDYNAMSRFDRMLWTLKNPLARIMASGSMEDTKARDARAKVLEEKASALAEQVRNGEDGGYDLGDAAFDPLQMLEGPGISNSVERDRREAEAPPALPAPMGPGMEAESAALQAPEEGAHGLTSTLQNDVLHGKPKTLLSLGSTGVGLFTDSLASAAQAQDKVSALNSKLNNPGIQLSANERSGLESQLSEAAGIAKLTGSERAIGIGSGLLQIGGSGLEAAGNIMKANSQHQKGDRTGAAAYSLDTISSLANVGIGLSKVAGYSSAVPGVVGTLGGEVIPALGIASGGMKMMSGGIQFGSALHTQKKMDDRIKAMNADTTPRTRDQERMYRTFKQARGMAKANAVGGAIKAGSGLLNVTGNAMTLGGVTALAGTVVSGAGSLVDLAGGVVTDKMKKGVRTDTVNEELGLSDKIQALMAQDDSITEREAKHIVLKSMGFSSGKRKEAFQHITMRRAVELYQRANSGDKEAESIVEDLGLSKTGSGYSLQGISEKLGMDSNMSWQEQMQATKESRGHNPFKKKKAAA